LSENNLNKCGAGLIVNKTGFNDNGDGIQNEVYNNKFTECLAGAVAMGVNHGGSNGLQYQCNEFNNSWWTDIWIYGKDEQDNLIPGAGIDPYQGKPGATTSVGTANNRFSMGSGASAPQILLDADQGIKYTHTLDPTGALGYKPTRIVRTTGTFNTNEKSFYFDPNVGCIPRPYAKIVTIAEGWQERTAALSQKGILENTLNNLEDGGNTPLLKNEVALTQLQNAYALYAKLLAKSPYVSEEVLEELAEKENFPKALARDILVANKHAGKDAKVWENLENRSDELPNYMLAQIQQAAESGLSGKEFLELAVNEQSIRYHNAIKGQIDLLDADNTATPADYEAVLATANGLGYQMRLVKAYTKAGNPTQANFILSDIPNRIALSATDAANYADIATLYPIQQQLQTQSLSSLTTAQKASLAALAGNSNAAQVSARALTEVLTQTRTYKEALPRMTQASNRMRKPSAKPSTSKVNDTPNILTLMPNPAKDYFSIETFSVNDVPTILNVYNAQGVLIHTINPQITKTVSTTDWAVGGYFYEYTIEGIVTQRGKLQVIR
jgi:hypothetical protein